MPSSSKSPKWHTIDPSAAEALTTATNTPGMIHPMAINVLPQQLQKITGVTSYYVSGYVTSQANSSGLAVAGEMLVARVDGAATKNYNYVFARDSKGYALFTGPFTGFGHHVFSGQSVQVSSLFGSTPFSDGRGA